MDSSVYNGDDDLYDYWNQPPSCYNEGNITQGRPQPEAETAEPYYSSLQPEPLSTLQVEPNHTLPVSGMREEATAGQSSSSSGLQTSGQGCKKPPCWRWIIIASAVVLIAITICITTVLVLNRGKYMF